MYQCVMLRRVQKQYWCLQAEKGRGHCLDHGYGQCATCSWYADEKQAHLTLEDILDEQARKAAKEKG